MSRGGIRELPTEELWEGAISIEAGNLNRMKIVSYDANFGVCPICRLQPWLAYTCINNRGSLASAVLKEAENCHKSN